MRCHIPEQELLPYHPLPQAPMPLPHVSRQRMEALLHAASSRGEQHVKQVGRRLAAASGGEQPRARVHAAVSTLGSRAERAVGGQVHLAAGHAVDAAAHALAGAGAQRFAGSSNGTLFLHAQAHPHQNMLPTNPQSAVLAPGSNTTAAALLQMPQSVLAAALQYAQQLSQQVQASTHVLQRLTAHDVSQELSHLQSAPDQHEQRRSLQSWLRGNAHLSPAYLNHATRGLVLH